MDMCELLFNEVVCVSVGSRRYPVVMVGGPVRSSNCTGLKELVLVLDLQLQAGM